jgi:hypothetical protein
MPTKKPAKRRKATPKQKRDFEREVARLAPATPNSPIKISTLVPGLLVHVSTSIKGNVKYLKTEGESYIREDGSEYTDWETERTVKDPKEQKLATEIRSKARSLIVGVCAATEHGLLCPEADREKLEEAYVKARKLVSDFNATAKTTRLKFNALAGRIAPDDLQAVRAINGEVRDLISEMQEGIEALDVERVRDAAQRAKKIGNMLSDEAKERIADAVNAVRKVAKDIVEAGEQAAIEVDASVINKLAAARTAFLDLDDAAEVQAPADTSGRALDLAPAYPDDICRDTDGNVSEPTLLPSRDLEID